MSSTFDAFKAAFFGDILTPADEGYAVAIARWAKNAVRKAALVVYPKDSADVSRAITYARGAGLQLAIRGGGHSAAGASSAEGGLVVDLSRYLGGVRVDAETRLGYVGGGAIWETVDKAAIEHGLATVGGTVNHTGVGGLVLGGGYGWLSGAYGLAIDNLVQTTIVTADGSVLTASETENPDLFWGLRGGGSNFGVVTEFVLKLYPQRRTVFCGLVIYAPHQLNALFDETEAWWNNGPSEKEGMIQAFTRGPDRNPCVVVFIFYNGSEEEGRQCYKAFFDIKPVADMAAEMPYEKLNTLQNEIAAHGQNVYMKGCFAPPSFPRTLLPQVFERVAALSEPPEYMLGLLCEYFPLGRVNAVPDDATAYRRGLASNLLCVVYSKEDSAAAMAYARDAAHELMGLLTGKEAGNIGYGNYSPDSDALAEEGSAPIDKSEVNFGSNYKRLQEIKKKYDPDVVFNKWFVIKPSA